MCPACHDGGVGELQLLLLVIGCEGCGPPPFIPSPAITLRSLTPYPALIIMWPALYGGGMEELLVLFCVQGVPLLWRPPHAHA